MDTRAKLIELVEKLKNSPHKSEADRILGTMQILDILKKNKDGNTFLRCVEDKPYLDMIASYIRPYATELNLSLQTKDITSKNSNNKDMQIKFALVGNIKDAVFPKLYTLLLKEHLRITLLAAEVSAKMGSSYQKMIVELQKKNIGLNQLFAQQNKLQTEQQAVLSDNQVKQLTELQLENNQLKTLLHQQQTAITTDQESKLTRLQLENQQLTELLKQCHAKPDSPTDFVGNAERKPAEHIGQMRFPNRVPPLQINYNIHNDEAMVDELKPEEFKISPR